MLHGGRWFSAEGRTRPLARSPVSPRLLAEVAKLVDAHGSGPCGGNPVEVQVLSSAPAFARLHRATAGAAITSCNTLCA